MTFIYICLYHLYKNKLMRTSFITYMCDFSSK